LWERDFDWTGFRWLDPNDADHSVLSFLRHNADGSQQLACVANLTPVVRPDYRIGLPAGGRWVEVLNTDAPDFAGSGIANPTVRAEGGPWQDQDHSATLTLPPLAVLWLVPERTHP
jgi:1,4-alpha-glucan branching enzyme